MADQQEEFKLGSNEWAQDSCKGTYCETPADPEEMLVACGKAEGHSCSHLSTVCVTPTVCQAPETQQRPKAATDLCPICGT